MFWANFDARAINVVGYAYLDPSCNVLVDAQLGEIAIDEDGKSRPCLLTTNEIKDIGYKLSISPQENQVDEGYKLIRVLGRLPIATNMQHVNVVEVDTNPDPKSIVMDLNVINEMFIKPLDGFFYRGVIDVYAGRNITLRNLCSEKFNCTIDLACKVDSISITFFKKGVGDRVVQISSCGGLVVSAPDTMKRIQQCIFHEFCDEVVLDQELLTHVSNELARSIKKCISELGAD